MTINVKIDVAAILRVTAAVVLARKTSKTKLVSTLIISMIRKLTQDDSSEYSSIISELSDELEDDSAV